MKRILVIIVSLVLLFECADHQRNDKCKTPASKDGTCIPLNSCEIIQPIIEAARARNHTARKLARAYQCGYDTEVLVCCDLLEIDDIFHKPVNLTPKIPTIIRKPIVLESFDSTDLPDRSVCGVSPPEGDRIWGGEQTELGEFPWAVAIELKKKRNGESAGIQCGGTLINDRYVVTAAHCIQSTEFDVHQVRLGEWNIKTDPDCYEEDLPTPECADRVEIYSPEKLVPHEYYSRRDSSNDIGLIKLDRQVKYTTYIRPICLPPPGLPLIELETYLTVVGWGLTENGSASDIKLKVDVPLVSNRVCREKIPRPISRNHYCAGGESGKDACRGDSGGPLMRTFRNAPDQQEQWFLEGIVGSGISCGTKGTPGIYLRVTSYTNWIIDKLAQESRLSQNTLGNKISPSFINFSAK